MKRIFTLTTLLLLVLGAANAITVKWDWENNIPDGIRSFTAIQNATGSIASNVDGISLYVDATSGKLGPNGGTPQFTAGTIIRVPVVSTSDEVTIKCYPGDYTYYVKINSTEYTTQTTTYTATAADVEKGYVEILSGCAYLYSVIAELAYMPVNQTVAKWDWQNTIPASISSVSHEQYSGDPIAVASDVSGISMDFVYGKLVANGDNAQFNSGTILHIPVTSTSDVVTVYYHPSGFTKVTIGGNDYDTQKTDYKATVADVTQGYVEVVSGGGYLYSVTLTKGNYTTATIGATGWATFSYTAPVDFSSTAGVVSAYIVTDHSGSAIITDDVTTADANTGLLLNADAGTYAIPLAATGTDLCGTNKLQPGTGAAVSAVDGKTRYVLVANGGIAEFQKIDGTSATVPVGKAYLEFTGVVPAPTLSFDFGTTNIPTTNFSFATPYSQGENDTNNSGEYYNLAGQRVANPTKGLYIVNGKKVIVK